jgi:RNA polymerase sigma-70 factor (ECF subfamily)
VQQHSFQETVSLVQGAQSGDRNAMEELFARYLPLVRKMAALSLGRKSRDLVEEDDIVQEALLDAFRRLDSFEHRTPGSFKYWLSSLVESKIRDRLRHERARKRGEGRVEHFSTFSNSVLSESKLAGRGPTPSQEARGAELEESLETALLALDESDRRIFQMRNLCTMEYLEIASALGIQENSARAQYSRVLTKLSSLA